MNPSLLLALALLQVPPAAAPAPAVFSRYRRSIQPTDRPQACVILDAATLAHAAPFLRDLRLYTADGTREVPYVLTLSEAQQSESETARILNLGMHGHTIEFDLAMPARPYTEVALDIPRQNFLATVSVRGASTPGSGPSTHLGDYTLFDLTSQHLSRSTTIPLQESSFPFLHIALTATAANGGTFKASPDMVRGATVPPSREAQTLFTVAAQTSTLQQHGRETVAHFDLPRRVPIERVAFILSPDVHDNFSRNVVVSSHARGTPSNSGDVVNDVIQRVKLNRDGHEIREQQLSIPATLGANLQEPAQVDVAINNGDDPPLAIASVQLLMRQRDLCFNSAPGQAVALFYGDAELQAPEYELARTFTPAAHAATLQLGPEKLNPAFRARPDLRPFTERHPHLLWLALLCVVGLLAFVALHSPKVRMHHHHH